MTGQNSRPNILFIMDDQHRFDYLGSAGAYFVDTPNLDRLSESGIRFTQATTNCPLCAPSRIALATGLQPTRLGALDNSCFLPASTPTYYTRLRDHGYRVGCVGKLDLAKPDSYLGRYGDRPVVYTYGFTHPEECEGKMYAGQFPSPVGPYTYHLEERGLHQSFHEDYRKRAVTGWLEDSSHDSVLPTDAFEDSYIGRNAAQWIENIPDDFPWHLFVSFVGPHDPFDPPTEFADRYRSRDMPSPVKDSLEGKPAWVRGRARELDPDAVAVTRRQYCAAIELIDDQVGRILNSLETRDKLHNTYVIFASDHGEMLGDHGLYRKQSAYEPSLRVPLLVSGPGIAGGEVIDLPVELIDINPTICDLADIPPLENIDARSFRHVLLDGSQNHRSETVSAIREFRCIRTPSHKLIQNYNDVTELYDLTEDPDELENTAGKNPDLVRSLRERLDERYSEGKWLR